jgi:hypothetical protein
MSARRHQVCAVDPRGLKEETTLTLLLKLEPFPWFRI